MNDYDRYLEILREDEAYANYRWWNFKSLKEFLTEANYGSLQSDDRIRKILDSITNDMKVTVNINDSLSDVLQISTYTKYKESTPIDIRIKWIFDVMIKDDATDFSLMSKLTDQHIKHGYRYFDINILLYRNSSDTDKGFLKKLNTYITHDIDINLLHEIKHMLDIIDGIFTSPNYIKPDVTNASQMKQYALQDKEAQTALISVISDIRIIKDQHPTYDYNKTIANSKYYKKMLSYFEREDDSVRLINKFKGKLVYFWYKEYENKDFNL